MNKKSLLLAISSLSLAGVFSVGFLSTANLDAKMFSINRGLADDTYTLQIDATDHLVAADSYTDAQSRNVSGFSILNNLGTKFFFHKNSNPSPNLNTNDSIVYVTSNVDSIVMFRSDRDAVEFEHPINGIKSITANFDIMDNAGMVDISDQVLLKVNYGFVHDDVSYFANEYTLESGVTYNFDNTLPSVFNLMTDMNGYTDGEANNYYQVYLRSLTITYSCSPSNTSEEAFLDKYFSGDPIVLEREGDIPTTIQCGAYPQTILSDNTKKTYLNAKYSTSTTLNGYYLLRDSGYDEGDVRMPTSNKLVPSAVKLYARRQAANTGYDNEYTTGEYYWFNVDPIEWRVLSSKGDNKYLVATAKVLDNGVKYKNNSTLNVPYTSSDLKAFIDSMSAIMLRTKDSIQLNNDFDAKVYALTATEYRAKSATTQPTAYGRTQIMLNPGLATGMCVRYWTNREGYSNPSEHRAEIINASGSVDHPYQTDSCGVRPGMIITLA